MTKKTKNKNAAKALSVAFTHNAWEEYVQWQSENPSIAEEINDLLKECLRNPFTGTGKPEPLKGDLSGYWSRRITKEHRLVYLPEDGMIYVVQCRLHY